MSFVLAAQLMLHGLIGISAAEPTPRPLAYQPAPAGNPLKGLVPYAGQGTRADGTEIFPHSLEFNYLPLGELMRGMDDFDWQPLERLLNDIAGRGHQSVFRIYLEYPGKRNVIPRFLLDGGLKVHVYTNTNTHPFPPKIIETPDYEDANLRATLTNFVAALGKRYDGDPRVGFITAGLLGTWGEWHTYPRNELWAGKATQRAVMEAYAAAFKQTPVLLRYPAGKDDWMYAENNSLPFGYHDDSFAFATRHTGKKDEDWFFVSKLMAAGATNKWKRFPIGGEIRPEVWGCCFDEMPCTPAGQSFDECVTDTHVSWLMDSGVFTKPLDAARRENAVRSVQRMGYELQVTEARFPMQTDGDSLPVAVTIVNHGVAPFYHHWPVELAVQDADGNRIKTRTTDWELPQIIPGEPATNWSAKLDLGEMKPGSYKLLMRVKNAIPNGVPFRFANESQDQDLAGWLTLGGFER